MARGSFIYVVLIAFLCMGFSTTSVANHKKFTSLMGVEATKEDVLVFMDKAETFFNTHTLEESEKAFSSAEFLTQDLYLFVLNAKGEILIHGLDPTVKGASLFETKDAEGLAFVKKFIETQDRRWVKYLWRHPMLGRIMKKNTFIVHLPGDRFMGAGYYVD
jgi:signal transduction histidine kinase